MEPQQRWVWIVGGEAFLIEAADYEEAYRKAIGNRTECGQTPEEAEAWFRKDDQLLQVEGKINSEPFTGSLTTCMRCGSEKPEGQSCGCFDNNSQ